MKTQRLNDKRNAEEKLNTEEKELNDIFPALERYQNAKAQFKQNRITQSGVNLELKKLVTEINEFLTVLNANTTAKEEHEILQGITCFKE